MKKGVLEMYMDVFCRRVNGRLLYINEESEMMCVESKGGMWTEGFIKRIVN